MAQGRVRDIRVPAECDLATSPGREFVRMISYPPQRLRHVLDLDRLLKLRLVVARFGEMDRAQWWNTKGQLGPIGATVLRRGFARTHYFAQARSVFAVASHRCAEVFDPPNAVTLWRLPPQIEEEFDARWEHWLDHADDWSSTFERVAALASNDLVADLGAFVSLATEDVANVTTSRRSAEARSLELPGTFDGSERGISRLALGFAKGERGALTVPWMRRDER